MKRLNLAVILALVAAGCQPPALMVPPSPGVHLDEQVLVSFESETGEAAKAALREKYGVREIETLPSGTERWQVTGAPRELAGAIAREQGVKGAQPNWERRLQAITPQDKDYKDKKQWHLQAGYLSMSTIWGSPDYGTQSVTGKGVIVAVVDSGVDMGHPDLAPNIVMAGGKQAFIDLVDDTFKAPTMDGNGHGTHVAGIIAAEASTDETVLFGGKGNIVGVAPEAKILPVQVMRADGGGDDFNIAKGIEAAVDWRGDGNARVQLINLSIGGADPSPTLAASLAYAAKNGVLVVAAAGNYNQPVYYPAAYPGALAVGAIGPRGTRAAYSCFGPQLAIMAPGGADPNTPSESLEDWGGIYSTFPRAVSGPSFHQNPTYYGAQAGTSMAAPVVAGVAALILSQNPSLTPDQLSMRLVATADDIGEPGFDPMTGWGKVNPKRALDWTSHDGGTP
ncbi:Subtilisin NAT precursor [compost metagenome]